MDKQEFISLYKPILEHRLYSVAGRLLIEKYIAEKGNEEQRKNSDVFLLILESIPPLFSYCVEKAVEYYLSMFDIIVLYDKPDPSILNKDGRIISIY